MQVQGILVKWMTLWKSCDEGFYMVCEEKSCIISIFEFFIIPFWGMRLHFFV